MEQSKNGSSAGFVDVFVDDGVAFLDLFSLGIKFLVC